MGRKSFACFIHSALKNTQSLTKKSLTMALNASYGLAMALRMASTRKCFYSHALLWATITSVPVFTVSAQQPSSLSLDPSKMPKLGTVDPRYVSYNIEMVEITGGRFWKPYKSAVEAQGADKSGTPPDANQQVGMNPNLFQYRPPIDLSNPRLRKLAQELGPSYVRVSGTWQNSTFFQNDDNPAMAEPPKGFRAVATRAQWKGVVDFARAADDRIVTSFAISPGARDTDGVWTQAQAHAILDYTKSIGGNIAAAEFMNEPTFPGPGGAPAGYDAAAFAKDAKVFEAFLRKESPQTTFLGPGGVGEGVSLAPAGMPAGMAMKLLLTDDLMKATGPIFDAFSYHFYGTISHRCMGSMTADKALTAEWLDRTDTGEKFYADLRDKFMPGKSMWLTETAEAACGGDQFAAEFVDTFRFLNQLGTLAQKGVQVVMHNTLASSDYGLLNEDTLEPRPNYWAALLWKRTMGSVVLDPDAPKDQPFRIYAHCAMEKRGGVTILALNADTEHEQLLTLSKPAERYTLTATALTSGQVLLNGTELKAEADGSVGPLKGEHVRSGVIHLAPSSVSFLVIPSAHNESCTVN
jgi:heparanase 1